MSINFSVWNRKNLKVTNMFRRFIVSTSSLFLRTTNLSVFWEPLLQTVVGGVVGLRPRNAKGLKVEDDSPCLCPPSVFPLLVGKKEREKERRYQTNLGSSLYCVPTTDCRVPSIVRRSLHGVFALGMGQWRDLYYAYAKDEYSRIFYNSGIFYRVAVRLCNNLLLSLIRELCYANYTMLLVVQSKSGR